MHLNALCHVQCTFGILKARFRMLKLPQLWTDEKGEKVGTKVENVFLACCVLHNMLLAHDNLDPTRTEKWQPTWADRDLDTPTRLAHDIGQLDLGEGHDDEDQGRVWLDARTNQTGALLLAAMA